MSVDILIHDAAGQCRAASSAVAVKLSLPEPFDLTDIDLSEY